MRGEKWGWGEGEEVGGSKEGRGYLHICPYILLILPSHVSHMSLTHSHTCHTCPLHTHTRVTHAPYMSLTSITGTPGTHHNVTCSSSGVQEAGLITALFVKQLNAKYPL